jgi:hypothetical protein
MRLDLCWQGQELIVASVHIGDGINQRGLPFWSRWPKT